jgi:uncharacterized protein (DUF305 family)
LNAAGLLAVIAVAGCSATVQQLPAPTDGSISPAAMARADSGRPAYTAADVKFMQGMIAHHAQAVLMARWASTHGASAELRRLAERIDVGQHDEMAYMQRWLRERGETVPDAKAEHDMSAHHTSGALMPGMLTHEQLMQLDEARGAGFDRLFLTFMIQHHQGALAMVEQLFSVPGAGQDVNVFRFASDVTADQTTEIERMQSMLSVRGADATRP